MLNKLSELLYDVRNDVCNAIIIKLLNHTHIYATTIYALLKNVHVYDVESCLESYKKSLDK